MDDEASPRKRRKTTAAPVQNDREQRLKSALKANMAKRKAQAKARAGQSGPADKPDRDQA